MEGARNRPSIFVFIQKRGCYNVTIKGVVFNNQFLNEDKFKEEIKNLIFNLEKNYVDTLQANIQNVLNLVNKYEGGIYSSRGGRVYTSRQIYNAWKKFQKEVLGITNKSAQIEVVVSTTNKENKAQYAKFKNNRFLKLKGSIAINEADKNISQLQNQSAIEDHYSVFEQFLKNNRLPQRAWGEKKATAIMNNISTFIGYKREIFASHLAGYHLAAISSENTSFDSIYNFDESEESIIQKLKEVLNNTEWWRGGDVILYDGEHNVVVNWQIKGSTRTSGTIGELTVKRLKRALTSLSKTLENGDVDKIADKMFKMLKTSAEQIVQTNINDELLKPLSNNK